MMKMFQAEQTSMSKGLRRTFTNIAKFLAGKNLEKELGRKKKQCVFMCNNFTFFLSYTVYFVQVVIDNRYICYEIKQKG